MKRIARLILAVIFVGVWVFIGLRVLDISSGPECRTTLCCEDCKRLSLSRIVDGDTLDSSEGRVRLYGVDTPERGDACFGEATDRLRELAGSSVRVEPGPRPRDGFGRSLYYVYTEDGESIDEKLVREGMGEAWKEDGQHLQILVALETEARSNSTGCIW